MTKNKHGWIEVTADTMPDFYITILFYAGEIDGVRIGALYKHTGLFKSDYDSFKHGAVTHWMPMPKAPDA